jgi:hypothetical protein
MKYAVKMGLGAMIYTYIPSFIKIGSDIRKLIEGHTQTHKEEHLIRHEDVWESGSIAPPFLTSALDEGAWSASRTGRFTLRERVSGTHSPVGPQSRSGRCREEKIFLPLLGNPTLAFQSVAYRYTD